MPRKPQEYSLHKQIDLEKPIQNVRYAIFRVKDDFFDVLFQTEAVAPRATRVTFHSDDNVAILDALSAIQEQLGLGGLRFPRDVA